MNNNCVNSGPYCRGQQCPCSGYQKKKNTEKHPFGVLSLSPSEIETLEKNEREYRDTCNRW